VDNRERTFGWRGGFDGMRGTPATGFDRTIDAWMPPRPENILLFSPDFPPPHSMNDLSSLALIRSLPPQWRQDAPRRIGVFVVHPASNELAGPAGIVRVRPRLMDVLLRLAVEPGAVVARSRLLEEVWPRRMVSDEVLSRTIAELRTVLGDDPRHPSYIETIPTVGYRLVAAVEDAPALPAHAGACAARSDNGQPASAPGATEPDAAHVAVANGSAGTGSTHGGTHAIGATNGARAALPAVAADALAAARGASADSTLGGAGVESAHDTDAARDIAVATRADPPSDGGSGAPMAAPRDVRRRVLGAAAVAVACAAAATLVLHFRDGGDRVGAPLAARIANATPYLSDPGLEMEPRFAPDGARIAFSSSTEFASRAHLVVLDLGASDARHLIGADDDGASYRSPVFVGGHRQLAYARCTDMHCRIVLRDIDGDAQKVLVAEDRAPTPNFDVSADGRWLVYANAHRPQFPQGLSLLDLATGATRDLTLPAANAGEDAMPRFAPDGRTIAFFRNIAGMGELWTIDADGSHASAAANARGAVYGAAWRDARHILVAADWFGFRSLNDVDLVTHTATFVGGRGARFPDIAPTGEIVYENAQFRTDLWTFDAASGTPAGTPSWPSTRFTMKPEYSPDGKRVVFVSNREGAEAAFIAAPGAPPVRVKLPEGFRYVNAHWSSDGRALYAVRLDGNPPHALSAVRFDIASGATTVLGELGPQIDEIYADARGRDLYFAVLDGQAMRLLRAPLADLAAQETLPFPLVGTFAVDATHIAFTQPQIRGLTLCTLADLACEALPLPISDSTYGAWTLGGGGVWYLDNSSTPPTLARYDLAERRVTLRASFPPMAFGRSIAVSPDGREVLVAREAPTLIDLMVAR
jgi:Tol biopolymer transport system component/DNA-binding winged helix-turn-helix (wHTH) protein